MALIETHEVELKKQQTKINLFVLCFSAWVPHCVVQLPGGCCAGSIVELEFMRMFSAP